MQEIVDKPSPIVLPKIFVRQKLIFISDKVPMRARYGTLSKSRTVLARHFEVLFSKK